MGKNNSLDGGDMNEVLENNLKTKKNESAEDLEDEVIFSDRVGDF